MDVATQLDRLLPAAITEAEAPQIEDDFIRFLGGLTKELHEYVLTRLPGRPIFDSLPVGGDGQPNPRQRFTDIICYNAILYYAVHASPATVIWHVMGRLQVPPGAAIRQLVKMMSRRVRKGFFEELIELDLRDPQRYGIVEEFEDYLQSQFGNGRPGLIDLALEKIITVKKEDVAKHRRPEREFELLVLQKLLHKRRADPNRLPKTIRSVREVRFVVEEIHRDLFVYETLQSVEGEGVWERAAAKIAAEKAAVVLLWQIDNWWQPSDAHQTVLKNHALMEVSSFFDSMRDLSRAIAGRWAYEESWKYYVLPQLRSEQFWLNLSGLSQEIPLEETEAGRRIAAYRRGAIIGPGVIVGVMLLPVVILVAVRTPGAVVQLVRWVGGRMLLASQYAASTIRVYGILGGAAAMGRDAYLFYMQNAVVVSQAVTNGAEIVLDIAGSGTGMAPGSSPADLSGAAVAQIAKVAEKGVAKLAHEAKTVVASAEREVELVEFVAEHEGKLYRVTAKIAGGDEKKIRTIAQDVAPAVEGLDPRSRKAIRFLSSAQNDNVLVQDSRAVTARAVTANGVSVPAATAEAFSHSNLLKSPVFTTIGGRKVKSWHPDVLVGTSNDQMSQAALAIITEQPNHPLAKALVDKRFLTGGRKELWAADPRYVQMAHIRSKKGGGEDMFILMSAHHNQRLGHDLELGGTEGQVLLDEAFDIGGIAVHRQTAYDLVAKGVLDKSVVDNATTVRFRAMDFMPAAAAATRAPSGAATTSRTVAAISDADRAVTARKAGQTVAAASTTTPVVSTPGGLLAAPKMTKIAGKSVKSWHPNYLVGTSDAMSDAALRIIKADANNPLNRILVDGRFLTGGNKELWKNEPRFIQLAHVRSKKGGGEDVLILMSAYHNQRFSHDLELANTPGQVLLDEAYAIGNVAIHKQTAHDLVAKGWLDKSAIDSAAVIDFTHLQFTPSEPADAVVRATAP